MSDHYCSVLVVLLLTAQCYHGQNSTNQPTTAMTTTVPSTRSSINIVSNVSSTPWSLSSQNGSSNEPTPTSCVSQSPPLSTSCASVSSTSHSSTPGPVSSTVHSKTTSSKLSSPVTPSNVSELLSSTTTPFSSSFPTRPVSSTVHSKTTSSKLSSPVKPSNVSELLSSTTTNHSPTEPTKTAHFPLFYVIIIASIGTALVCGMLVLLVYILCLKLQKRKNKRRTRSRGNSERVALCNLERMSSTASSSQASTDGPHELSVISKTEVVLRKHPTRTMSENFERRNTKHLSRNISDSLDRRSSKLGLWLQGKGSLKQTHHSPTLSCSTFKPNQQLYLPHVQVQVHVSGDLSTLTPESRVGSFVKLNETETLTKTECPSPPRPPSANSGDSITHTMLHTR